MDRTPSSDPLELVVVGAGPHALDQAASQKGVDPTRPELDNAPNAHGGKRGLPVLGNHFETEVEVPEFGGPGNITGRSHKPRPGFREAHAGDRAGEVHPAPAGRPVDVQHGHHRHHAPLVAGLAHLHAVDQLSHWAIEIGDETYGPERAAELEELDV